MNGILKKLMLAMLLILVATPVFAATSTTIGKIVTTPTDTSIWVSASYTDDSDVSNTLTIIYKPSTVSLWSSGTTNTLTHAVSPYRYKISGLTNGTAYDVRVQFNDAGGVTGTNPQDFMRVIPSTMMHNSENATNGAMKWSAQGGWGIPGGKYDQFECGTCHQPRATNIKSVKRNIATPDGSNWGSVSQPSVTVTFRSLTTPDGFGDDTGGHTTSQKICEVCHSQTDFHRFNTTGQGDLTHNNNSNCTSSCHKHDVGFKGAGGTCADCHGATPSVYWSVNLPDGTAGNAPGSHAKHYGTNVWPGGSYDDSNQTVVGSYYRFSCGKCHEPFANMQNAPDPNITLASTALPPSNGGTYNANVCSTVYCHGAFANSGGTKVNLAWTTTLNCTTSPCHGSTASTYTIPGAHRRHTGTVYGANQGMNLACTQCHGANQGNTGHVNGSVSWDLNTNSNLFGAGAVYNTQQAGQTGAVAPSGTYQACNNVYCHSSVQANGGNAGPSNYALVTWATATVACDSCHGQAAKGTGQPITGSHWRHASTLSYSCDVCHLNYGDEHPQHANYLIDSGISATYNGVAAAAYSQSTHTPGQGGYGTCSSVYCHGSYVGSGGTNTVPTWGQTAACGTCHLAGTATPAVTPSTGSHQKHTGAWSTSGNAACTECHGPSNGVGGVGHMDLHVDWRFNTTNRRVGAGAAYRGSSVGSTAGKAPSASFGQCSNVYCHSNVQAEGGVGAPTSYATPVWGSSGTAQCGSCHAMPQASGKHTKHLSFIGTTASACSACHFGAGDETIYHARGTINLALNTILYNQNATYGQGNQGPGTGYASCSNVYCHGAYPNSAGTNTRPAWTTVGGAAVACGDCHRASSATPAVTPITQAHAKHAGGWTTAVNLACTKCHGPSNGTGALGHMDLHVDWRFDTADARLTQANYRGAASGATSYKAQGTITFGNCTSVYCHSTVQNDGGTAPGTFVAANWGSTGSANCGLCHGNPPATGKHAKHVSTPLNASINCQTCHYGAGDETPYHSRGTINLVINTIYNQTAAYSQGNHAPGSGGYGNCTNVYCHGDYPNSAGTYTNPFWTTVGGAAMACGDCHLGTAANPPTTGSHPKHAGAWTTSSQLACLKCHGPSAGIGTVGHQNLSVEWRFDTNDRRVGAQAAYRGVSIGSTGSKATASNFGSCSTLYCHSSVQGDGGTLTGVTYATPVWGSSGTAQCGSCHGQGNVTGQPATGKHAKHAGTLGYLCSTCHFGAGDETIYHARGTINLAINTILYGTTAYYNQGNAGPGTGYGQCYNVYCHGGYPNSAGTNTNPAWTTVGGPSMACGTCHRAGSATPATTPIAGSHTKHAGAWTTAVNLGCTKCHGQSGIGTIGHMDLNVQWSFDTTDTRFQWFTTGTYKSAVTGSTGAKAGPTTYGSCTNIYCHSNVQANGGNSGPTSYASPVWGSSGTGACGTCHAVPANTGGHRQHLLVYGTVNNTSCQICHFGAGDETPYHARGTINLRIGTTYWSAGTWASYSQGDHKSAGGAYGNCSNTTCHGGPSKIWNSITNVAQCTKCHGNDWSTTTYTLYKAAPGADGGTTPPGGHDNWGSTGTYSDRVSNNPQVGAHDAHLRALSTISLPVSCNQCHIVPGGVTSLGHNNTGRRAEITWGTFANWNTNIPAATWSSNALTQCSNLYCHGAKMPRGDTSGTNRAPSWTSGSYLRTIVWQTNVNGGCGTCHGSPPTLGAAAGTHGTAPFPGSCAGCHPHVANNGSFNTIALHIDGFLQASGGDCIGCHSSQLPKNYPTSNYSTIRRIVGTGGDFDMAVSVRGTNQTRHLYNATTITKWDCTVCHLEGWYSTADRSSLHNDTNGLINLRNVDLANDTGWAVDNVAWNSSTAVPRTGWYTNSYANLDNFCLSCHDANGAAAAYVSTGNNSLGSGGRALTPFNTTDVTAQGYISGSTWNTWAPRMRVTNVKDQFYPGTNPPGPTYNGNPSQHAVIGQRYSTINTNWGVAAAWVSIRLKKMDASLQTVKETALLSCADCHVLDAGRGAHGDINKYGLWGTSAVSNFCWRCHGSTVYNPNSGTSAAGSRITHSDLDGSLPTRPAFGLPSGGLADDEANCLNCHASYPGFTTVTKRFGYGGIHGSWNTTASWYTTGTATRTGYRFFPGAWMRMSPGASDGAWNTGVNTQGSCYFYGDNSTQGFSDCSSHAGTGTATLPRGGSSFQYNRSTRY